MSNLLNVKLRRDLRAVGPRIVLMVVAIAVSLTAFGVVLYARVVTDRELSRAYLRTEPASATIALDRPVGTEKMTRIAAAATDRPGVIAATGRTQFAGPVEVNGQHKDNQLQVFASAPDDPMRVARFEVRQGSWPPARGEILLGHDTFALLGAAVGDILTVTTPNGTNTGLRVSGVVYDPSLAPAPQEQRGQGYVSTASLGDAMDQLKIQVAGSDQTMPSDDRGTIAAATADLAEWLRQEHGLAIREIQVPEPYAHPHQGQADALLISLLVGGAAALLLAAILVANMLAGLFAQQIPQIGVMKAIGAGSARIARRYLAMTVVIAAAATLLALVPGVLISRAWIPSVLGFLGIDAVSLAPPWWSYLIVLSAGLVLPPLMALIPLVRTSRTTVRAAIDHRGLSSSPRVLRWFGRMPGLDRGLVMALRNAFRRPARFVLSVGLLASAGILFVAAMSTRDGLEAVAEAGKQVRTWDVDVQLGDHNGDPAAIVSAVDGVSRVEGWTIIPSGVAGPGQAPVTRTYPDQGHGSVAVTAIPGDTKMSTPPDTMLEGRWLNAGETGAIVLNQAARANTIPDVHAGDTVQVSVGGRYTTWRVVGIAQERQGSGGAYVTADGLTTAIGKTRVNRLRIVTDQHDEQTRIAVAVAVEKRLTDASVPVRSAVSVSQAEAAGEGHLSPIVAVVLIVAVAMAAVGCVGLASTMSTNILERTREFGVMHAIGALPKAVRRIVVAEGVFIAVASCLVASIPTVGLTLAMGAGLGNAFMYTPLPFRISMPAVGIWIVLVVAGAVLATRAAATRASRVTVREALAYV